MLRLLQWIIFGHVHKWKKVDHYDVYNPDTFSQKPYQSVHVLECEHCGKRKNFITGGGA